jgi:hypothetical protein
MQVPINLYRFIINQLFISYVHLLLPICIHQYVRSYYLPSFHSSIHLPRHHFFFIILCLAMYSQVRSLNQYVRSYFLPSFHSSIHLPKHHFFIILCLAMYSQVRSLTCLTLILHSVVVKKQKLYSNIYPTRCNVTQFIYIWKLLYMFRVVPPPIIRSAYNCVYSIWYLSHRYCYLLL